jgi:hypothetical protein
MDIGFVQIFLFENLLHTFRQSLPGIRVIFANAKNSPRQKMRIVLYGHHANNTQHA